MIVPIRKSGSRPPLIMLHGLYGTFARAPEIADAVGSDQPFYALIARGLDARQPPCQTAVEMTENYVREIRSILPSGPYRLGSICSGAVMAIEVANALAKAGEVVETVLMIDPQTLLIPAERYQALDQKPKALQQLYENATKFLRKRPQELFDNRDPRQLHLAALAAVATAALLTIHRPAPYSGSCDLIVSTERAPVYFQPRQSWQSICWQEILVGSRRLHVMPGNHSAIFRADFPDVLRLMRFALDRAGGVSGLHEDADEDVDGEAILAAEH